MPTRFKERKVKPGEVDHDPQKCGFTETKKYKVLHCSNLSGNNNKFYCLELQYNPSTGHYRLFSHYGRLVLSEVFGVRDFDFVSNSKITDPSYLEQEMDSIVKSKLRGKTVKDEKTGQSWRENYEEVETFAPTVGSSNIRGKSNTVVVKSTKASVDVSNITNPKLIKIINQIVDENIHSITNATSLTLTSNGFETPLGPVTKEHVQKARTTLDDLKSIMRNDKLDKSESVKKSNNLYFSLIPHDFGRKIQESDWILDASKLIQEYDLLEQLESAVTMGSSLNATASQKLNALGIDFEELEDPRECHRLSDYVHNSKASNHRGSDVWQYRVNNIFKIRLPNERLRFETQGLKLSNIKELFHGSKNCNILSILMNGLIIPPVNASNVTGRMLGDGLYFAHNSSKSLNYSTNFWNSNNRNKSQNVFLFIAKVAMGREYETTGTLHNLPHGYDSVHAKAGGALYNDEYVVYKLPQATLCYLVEMIK